jgi:hypothetical protein
MNSKTTPETANTPTADGSYWTGTHVHGSNAAIVVRYRGPTDHRGARYLATCVRGRDETWRASATFQDGPLAAARALIASQGLNWELGTVGTIDGDTYVVVVA